jgi:hypothetical protein
MASSIAFFIIAMFPLFMLTIPTITSLRQRRKFYLFPFIPIHT